MIWHKNHSGLDSNSNIWKNKQAVSTLKLAVACWREWHGEEKSMHNKRKACRNEKCAEGEKQAEGKITLKPKGKVCRREKHRKWKPHT